MNRIAPCLWFDHQAEEAATFYVSVFKNSKITNVTRYSKAGFEIHRPAGSVMTVEFELDGRHFTAPNGGQEFTFNEAVSFQVLCDTPQDIDYCWDQRWRRAAIRKPSSAASSRTDMVSRGR